MAQALDHLHTASNRARRRTLSLPTRRVKPGAGTRAVVPPWYGNIGEGVTPKKKRKQ